MLDNFKKLVEKIIIIELLGRKLFFLFAVDLKESRI